MKGFYSEYFTIRELAEGVFAAIENKDSCSGSNSGIIDLGNYTIVFDTFLSIDAARDLRKASIELTGREPQFVIISHFHMDHIVGNQVFGQDTRIVSTIATKDMMVKQNEEFEGERSQYNDEIKKTEEQLKNEKDQTVILNLKNTLLFLKNLAKPEIKLRMPDVIIENNMTLTGDTRRVEVIVEGMAHTPGDIILYIPEDGICFMGDMLCKGTHPWLGSGDPDSFIEKLDRVLMLGAKKFVPGHGDIAVSHDVELHKQYIQEIKDLVERKANEENPSFDASELSDTYKEWNGLCFMWNINFLLKRMTEAGRSGGLQ